MTNLITAYFYCFSLFHFMFHILVVGITHLPTPLSVQTTTSKSIATAKKQSGRKGRESLYKGVRRGIKATEEHKTTRISIRISTTAQINSNSFFKQPRSDKNKKRETLHHRTRQQRIEELEKNFIQMKDLLFM